MNTPITNDDTLVLYGQSFSSRLLLGTSRYPSPSTLKAAVQRAQPAMVTASLRRQGSNPAESVGIIDNRHEKVGCCDHSLLRIQLIYRGVVAGFGAHQ